MKSILGLLVACVTFVSFQSYAGIYDAAAAPNQYSVPGAMITEYEDLVMITIDGYNTDSVQQLHEIIAMGLKLPNTYGKNFDALYDVLTDPGLVSKQIDLTVFGGEALKQKIGSKNIKKLLKVMNDAQEADPMHVSTMYWQ